MTRKDFQLIADAIRQAKPTAKIHDGSTQTDRDFSYAANVQWSYTVNRISEALQSTNDRFDTELFLKACGVE